MGILDAQNEVTLKKILAVVSKRVPINYEMYPLYIHEIESLIPVKLLDNICKEIPDASEGIRFLGVFII